MPAHNSVSPSDDEIARYAEGQADPELAARIEADPAAQAAAADYSRLTRGLRSRLFRFDCPSGQTLAEFHAEITSPADTARIAAHTRLCPHCRSELVRLDQYMREPLIPASFFDSEGAVDRVRRWIRAARAATSAPGAPAFVTRSSAPRATQAFDAEAFRITVAIERDRQRPAQKSVLGLMTWDDHDMSELSGAPVSLLRDDEPVAATELDDFGNFVFDAVTPGRYSLLLRLDDTDIEIPDIDVPA